MLLFFHENSLYENNLFLTQSKANEKANKKLLKHNLTQNHLFAYYTLFRLILKPKLSHF